MGKVISSKDDYVTKVVEQLERENMLSSDELSRIEDYLRGNRGDEVLEKFDYRDLSGMAEPSILHNFYVNMLAYGRFDEARRFEKVFFAIGEASSYKLFSLLEFCPQEQRCMLEPIQKAAVHAALLGQEQYRFKRLDFEQLITNAEYNPENLRKAMNYQTGKFSCGILVLLTAYFYMKYPKVNEGIKLEEEDAAFMGRYEKLMIELIPEIYPNSFSRMDADELMAAVTEDRVDGEILKLAGSSRGNNEINEFFLCIVSRASFVNHGLSSKLKNIVCICLAINWEVTLNYIEMMDLRGDLMGDVGGCFDKVFHMNSRNYIQWAAKNRKVRILEEQFRRNREVYLEYMDAVDRATYHVMVPIAKKMAPELFQKHPNEEKQTQRSKLIEAFTSKTVFTVGPGNKKASAGDDIRKYLSGEGGIEHVYACKDILKNRYYWSNRALEALKNYRQKYGYDALGNRCDTLLLASNGYLVFQEFVGQGRRRLEEVEVKRVFAAADSEGLNLKTQWEGYVFLMDNFRYNTAWTTALQHVAKAIFGEYLTKRREEMLSAFQETGSAGRSLGLSVMAEQAEVNKEIILSFARDSAKAVKEALLNILYQQKGWEKDIVRMLSSKKAAERDTAIRVLAKWKDEETIYDKYTQILSKSLEAEKNAKVRALLEGVLYMGVESSEGGKYVTQDELVRELHKGNKKRSLSWAYEEPFSKVHKKDGTEAREEYMQAIFLCYSAISPCGVNKSAASLAKDLDEKEFAVYVNELFDKWMEAGAEAKKRWVLYAAAIHGGDDIVKKLHHQIQEWPKEARGAIASEAVQALALSPTSQGLLIVDGISRKFKFKQVKTAAAKALEFAASQLGITTEELADRIVPDLGFDENMQRIFDYGERKFTVTITTALEVEVFDENGKKLKNLPAPGKKDDEAKAMVAYEEFKQMKKQMKTAVSGQKMRLEMALSIGRQWSVQAWKNLFVKNPIMQRFAIGLIWGVYEDRKLVSSFRYMEDGSFYTEDEEEFILPEDGQDAQSIGHEQFEEQIQSNDGQGKSGGQSQIDDQGRSDNPNQIDGQGQAKCQGSFIDQDRVIGRGRSIGLMHPIELSQESLNNWKEQLDDYEIIQPIEQLGRQIYYRTEEEENQKELARFQGVIVNDLSLNGKLTNQGWYRGPVGEGGSFSTYYREEKELDLGVVLYFSGSYAGGANEDVTVYEIRFFKTDNLPAWSNVEKMKAKSCCLSEVPERYYSEIVLQIAKATSASKKIVPF